MSPYTVHLQFGEQLREVPAFGSQNLLTNLATGRYEVWVTDANGCTALNRHSVTIGSGIAGVCSQPLEELVDSIQLSLSGSCSQSTALLQVHGLRSAYQLSIDGGVTWTSLRRFTNISPGSYVLQARLRQETACTYVAADTLHFQRDGLNSSGELIYDPPICGDSTGYVAITGQEAEVEYSFDAGATWQGQNFLEGILPDTLVLLVRLKHQPVCSISFDTVFVQPEVPSITVDSLIPPTCAGTATGVILLQAEPGLIYRWADGTTGAQRRDLPAGVYTAYVSNGNCSDSIQINLSDAVDHFIGMNPPRDTAICGGSELRTTLPVDREAYSLTWVHPDGVVTSADTLRASLDGTYTLSLEHLASGCTQRDTFTVTYTDPSELVADFLLPSQAVINEAVAAIDITYPTLDTTYWSWSDPSVLDLGAEGRRRWFEFTRPGTFEISMTATSEDCAATASRSIRIYASADSLASDSTVYTGEIIDVVIYPNPFREAFTVEVELSEATPLTLFLFNAAGQLVKQTYYDELAGRQQLSVTGLADQPPGEYNLVLRSRSAVVWRSLIGL